MADARNYILGRGELLAKNDKVAMGFGEGSDPYSFSEQRRYVAPLISHASALMDKLPQAACPNDEAVAVLTLHPKYLSKSAYPNELLKATGLRVVGSKAVQITPRKSHLKEGPKLSVSSEMYVAGTRASFRRLANSIEHLPSTSASAADLIKVEAFRLASPEERIKPIASPSPEVFFEVILHAGNSSYGREILTSFRTYLQMLKVDVDLEDRLDAQDLSFIPLRSSMEVMRSAANFAFLRMAREMPHVRAFWPTGLGAPSSAPPLTFPITLPVVGPLDPTIRVAVFDGGCPDVSELANWVVRKDAGNVQLAIQEGLTHGLAVTSALLFGSLSPTEDAKQPYAKIDHYRIVDIQTRTENQKALYPMLRRIVEVLNKNTYDFVNFSVGPSSAIQDDDIDPWTALIDPLLASGKTLATIAVGNDGESDAILQYNRIQPPSDCVNALSVGACDTSAGNFIRTPYSSVGHGRCPGVMKPDGVAFGGQLPAKPFNALAFSVPGRATSFQGTSFAAPAVLRTAIGIRAQLGPVISGLALKALLIHNCEITAAHAAAEVGWGRFPEDIGSIISSSQGVAHILYQGTLDPKKFLRAEIPIPHDPLVGDVTISATLCFASETDSQHPLTYTRNGLQIFFSRDRNEIPPGKTNPKRTGFFKARIGMPEQLLRSDAHQWETVRRATKKMRGSSLVNPFFDIHLNPREDGHDTAGDEVPYAMIITIEAPKVPDLFGKIFDRYRFTLQELKPRFELQLKV